MAYRVALRRARVPARVLGRRHDARAGAGSAGMSAGLYTRFPDATVAGLVGADQVHEWPVALVTLGPGKPAIDGAGPAEPGETDSKPLEFPLVTAAQRELQRLTVRLAWF